MSQISEPAAATPGGRKPIGELATMIKRGRSFSGQERNCVFLNLGMQERKGKGFANVSAGSGLDFADDGRSIALVDWDHDGDLDLWISNRTAPQLRLMRNEMPAGDRHFVALRLLGNGGDTNRDAIGARVEVVAGGATLLRTLRAGEGFLAQSSKWLHIGLGGAEEIERVRVRWPNAEGRWEEFTELATDGRFVLEQGKGTAIPAKRRDKLAWEPSVQPVLPVTRSARISLVTQLRAPALNIADGAGRRVQAGAGKPVLVNLWASWCAPCLAELGEIRDREGEIRAAGLEVLALSVEGLDNDPKEASAAAGAAIKKLKFPFVSAMASEQVAGLLQWHHDNAVGLHRRLPLPSSVLLDAEGKVAVIYKGRVSVDQVLADVKETGGSLPERWARAAQLPGRAIEDQSVRELAAKTQAGLYFQHGVQHEERGEVELAAHYYQRSLIHGSQIVPAHRALSNLHARQANWAMALKHFETLLGIDPHDSVSHYAAGRCQQNLGQKEAARRHFEETVRLKSDHVEALDALGTLDLLEEKAAAAIARFREVIRLSPKHQSARNNLAWILATNRDNALRDGTEALKLATALVAEDQAKNAMFLDTLAAAQAENGQFEDAVATARKGLAIARAGKNNAAATQIEKRIPYYQRGEAYRE